MKADKTSMEIDYIKQAEQCLKKARDLADREARCAQRQMAAELLKLADAVSRS